MWIWVLGCPFEPVAPVEIGSVSDFIFSGKRVNPVSRGPAAGNGLNPSM
jgi:hypothetical protein